ncbi:MAG: hypothetical protein JWP69_1614 [Flaviaesturariibacter sp.]|nr:hypothetical protein [Flaviaesturariibacter sp.]
MPGLIGTTHAAAQNKKAAAKNFLQVMNQVLREGIQNRQVHKDLSTIIAPVSVDKKGNCRLPFGFMMLMTAIL